MNEKTVKLNILRKGGVFASKSEGLIPLTSKNCIFSEKIAEELINAGLAEKINDSLDEEKIKSLTQENEILKSEDFTKKERIKKLEERGLEYEEEIEKLTKKSEELETQVDKLIKERKIQNEDSQENLENKKVSKKNKE